MHAQWLSGVRLCVTPWTIARQAPLFMGFSRQEYWSRLPFPPPGDLPNSEDEPTSPALADGFFAQNSEKHCGINIDFKVDTVFSVFRGCLVGVLFHEVMDTSVLPICRSSLGFQPVDGSLSTFQQRYSIFPAFCISMMV